MPGIFPRGKLDLNGAFEALSISASITIGDRLESGKDRKENDYHFLGLILSYRCRECPFASPLRQVHDPTACRCQRIVRACKRILQKCDIAGEGIPDVSDEELFMFRRDVMGMLLVVESWLRRQCLPRELRCAKFIFARDTIQLQQLANFLKSSRP